MATPQQPAPDAPSGGRRHVLRAAWGLLLPPLVMLLLLALVLGAIGGAGWWLLRSEAGTAWLLARLPGVEVRGLQGALLSDRFAAERLAVRWDQGREGITFEGLQAEGLRWSWQPEPGAWFGLDAAMLRARHVVVDTGPRGPRPIPLPRTLRVPLKLQLAAVEAESLQVDTLPPLLRLRAKATLGAGAEQRLEVQAVDWDRVHATLQATIGTAAPYPLRAEAMLRPRDGDTPPTPWSAQVRAAGTLAKVELSALLGGGRQLPAAARAPERAAMPTSATEPPSLELTSTLTPLEAWPVASLTARTRALDLSALASRAPRTRLSGSVEFTTRALDAPVAAEIKLDNLLAGRWDEQRLPLRRIEASVVSRVDRRDEVVLERFDLQLGSTSEAAGRAQGQGRWSADQLQAQLQIDGLRPQWLDSRAAAMTLSGPVELRLQGLPAAGSTPSKPRAPAAEVKGTLEGRFDAAPRPVELAFDVTASSGRIELRRLNAQAGAAHATLSADAERRSGGDWHLKSQGTLAEFDPLPWWPGAEGSAWRKGPHRLSGEWSLDLLVPARLRSAEPLALAQALVGTGTLRVADSLLAGVPLTARIDLGHRPGLPAAPSQIQGELAAGGNRFVFDGHGDPMGSGDNDRMRIELQAENVGTLAPLVALAEGGNDWLPKAGTVGAAFVLEGRWPAVRSVGQAQARQLQAGELTLSQGRATWQVDSASDQPLAVQVDAGGLALARQRIEQLRADLRGTLREHRLDATMALPASPPRALELLFGLRTRAGTLARLQAAGQWRREAGGIEHWSGRVEQLTLGAWDGIGREPLPGPQWVQARDLAAELFFEPQAGITRVQAAAGRVQLADSVTLRWDDVRIDLRGAAPAFELRAEIEPFALAPLLARTQPTLGWGGDLQLAARVELRAADKLDTEVVFERRGGDLRLTDANGIVTTFGLERVRAALSAHDGRWLATAAFSGQTIGEASAMLQLRTRAEQRWPGADTPIDGSVDARVADLGIWSPWVPPGWRLSGAMRTSASVGGSIGAPDYSGEVRADEVSVRNRLLGVDLREGEARISLQGSQAHIQRFSLKGGEGRLTVSGSADLGGTPGAQLRLEAERFRVLGRIDRQLTASGRATLGLGLEQIRLAGAFTVDEGLFDLSRADAPSLDDDVNVRRGAPVQADQPAEPPRTRRPHQVAVEIDLGKKLHVRGRGLDTTLEGKLRLGSQAGKLTVHGKVEAAGGTYAAYGQKLEIERGELLFSGEPDNPALDVLALRPNIDLQVGVAIGGNLLSPRVRLYSGTEMSESDKLSWLVLGRASEGLGRTDTALLQRAAVALLAGEGEAPTDAMLRRLGIDEFSFSQREGDVRETVISFGKQLSRRWYLGYERGVNTTTGTFQLIYRIAQRFTLRAQSGQENSLDVIWTWRLEDPPPQAPPPTPVPKSPAAPP